MTAAEPLVPKPTLEVPLPRAPLARVICQAKFPPILAILSADKVADFQEALRDQYPNLSEERVHSFELTANQEPRIGSGLVWRFSDHESNPKWRVSLGKDFLALETSKYDSRQDFLDRLRTVVQTLDKSFAPSSISRLGLRYIDRLTDQAIESVSDLIQPEVLGLMRRQGEPSNVLHDSVINIMTEAQFLGQDGSRINGRWGKLPPSISYDPGTLEPIEKPSWILDLDMFTTSSRPFLSDDVLKTAESFAVSLYWLFRQMVTDEFLRFYGGKP